MLCIKNSEELYFSVSESVDNISQGVSLRLLKIIERTVTNLAKEQRQLESLTTLIMTHTPSDECRNNEMIDPEDRITVKLMNTQDLLQERITMLEGMCESAKEDPELNDDHEENVVMEFERTIECMVTLHNAVNTLRWRIAEHDANLDEVDGTFTDAESLVAHIGD